MKLISVCLTFLMSPLIKPSSISTTALLSRCLVLSKVKPSLLYEACYEFCSPLAASRRRIACTSASAEDKWNAAAREEHSEFTATASAVQHLRKHVRFPRGGNNASSRAVCAWVWSCVEPASTTTSLRDHSDHKQIARTRVSESPEAILSLRDASFWTFNLSGRKMHSFLNTWKNLTTRRKVRNT